VRVEIKQSSLNCNFTLKIPNSCIASENFLENFQKLIALKLAPQTQALEMVKNIEEKDIQLLQEACATRNSFGWSIEGGEKDFSIKIEVYNDEIQIFAPDPTPILDQKTLMSALQREYKKYDKLKLPFAEEEGKANSILKSYINLAIVKESEQKKNEIKKGEDKKKEGEDKKREGEDKKREGENKEKNSFSRKKIFLSALL